MSRQEFEVSVDFYHFGLQESDDADLPVPYPDEMDLDDGWLVKSWPGRIDFRSAGHTHTAKATVEVWDGAPPEDADTWDVVEDTTLTTTSGNLAFWDMGRSENEVTLGSGGTWQVRVASSGRRLVSDLTELGEDADGVEQYLIQFWRKN